MPKDANVRTRYATAALLCAFFWTGATSLIFEVVWARLLPLSAGTPPVAMGVVLGACMGGMALGSWLAGLTCLRRLAPIAVYAGLQLGIGLYALVTPFVLRLGELAPPGFQLAVGVALLLPAAVAMGTSLPVLVRVLDRDTTSRATTVGWLYAVTTAGGVAGPLLTVFLLFPLVGVLRTLVIAALINLLVGGVVWLGRSSWAPASPPPAVAPAGTSPGTLRAGTRIPRQLYLILAVSGATAMIYEMAWSRTLSMVYGLSVYGLAITLSSSLVGIALGSALAAVWVRRRPATMLGAVWLLVGSAWAAFVSLYIGGRLPFLVLDLYRWADGGTTGLVGVQFVLALLLMLPATLCLGALLPVVVSVASTAGARSVVASLYASTLLGSAIGAGVAAGLLGAGVGLNASMQVGVLVALGMAIATTVQLPGPHARTIGAAVVAITLVLALDGSVHQRALSLGLHHGALSGSDGWDARDLLGSRQLFYRDGPTASVAVHQVDREVLLKINGATDASTSAGDIETQTLLGHLPLMAAGPVDRVAVIGFGSGMIPGAVLTHPVREVAVFEIEPAVVTASGYFEPINGRPLEDDRLRLVIGAAGDARSALRREVEPYDVIISASSTPWTAGGASLFTRDFFELIASRLVPGGVFAQRVPMFGLSEDSAREVMATFRSMFPHAVAFNDRDLILLGSDRPISFSLDQMTRRFAEAGVRASLAEAYVRFPADLLVKLRLDERGTAAFATGAVLNTDDNMRLELAAPWTVYHDRLTAIRAQLDRHPPAPLELFAGYASPAEAEIELAASYFTARRDDEALRHCERALAIESSFDGLKLLGQIVERRGDRRRARNAWRLALATGGDPAQRALVQALLSGAGVGHLKTGA